MNHSVKTLDLSDFLRRYWPIVISTTIISILVSILYGLENWVILLGPPVILVLLFGLLNFEFSLYLPLFTMLLGGYLVYQGHVTPSSLAMGVIFLSYLVKVLASGRISISRTPLDKAIVIFIAAITLSLINVRYLYPAIWTYLWHIGIFMLFYAVVSGIKSSSVTKLISFLIFSVTLYSIPLVIRAILRAGAGRFFGIGGTYTATLTEITFLFCLSFFFFERRFKYKILWGTAVLILLSACLANKTRGAVIGLTFSYVFINIMTLRKSFERELRFVLTNMAMLVTAITSGIILLSYKLPTFSEGFKQHLYYATVPIDTTQIRLFLWGSALKFFSQSPILGVGLGQFSKLSILNLEPRYQLFYLAIVNLGPHNLLLSYLCETGIVGALSFMFLLYSSLKLAWSKFKASATIADLKTSGALLGALFYITINSFYSGAWTSSVNGIIFAYVLAWVVVSKVNSPT